MFHLSKSQPTQPPMSNFSLGLYQFKSIEFKIEKYTMAELDFIIGLFLMRITIDPMLRGVFHRKMGVTWDVFGMILKEKILRKDVKFYSLRLTIDKLAH